MLRFIKNLVLLSSALLTTQTVFAQTESAATVPSAFLGTYTLTYNAVNDGGPFADGEEVTLVLGSDNTLCVNNVMLSNPVHRGGNQAEGIWRTADNGLELAVSNFQGAFNEVNVASQNGAQFYGQLTGNKTSTSTNCSGGTEVTANMQTVFELAEEKVPEYFPPGAVTRFLDGYVYRFYESTGIYVAVNAGKVYLLGGAFGGEIVEAGSISSVLNTLESYRVNAETGVDLWTLTVSGTFDTSVIQNLQFSGLTLNDVPAPNLDNVDEINEEILSTLEGVATGINSISIDVVNNQENRRTFDVSFNATVTGTGNVTYNLRYDYTR